MVFLILAGHMLASASSYRRVGGFTDPGWTLTCVRPLLGYMFWKDSGLSPSPRPAQSVQGAARKVAQREGMEGIQSLEA